MVSLDGKEKVSIISVDIPKTVSPDRDAKHWTTNDLTMSEEDRTKCLEAMLGAERVQARKAVAMLKHLLAQSTYEFIPDRVSSNINYHEELEKHNQTKVHTYITRHDIYS